jgi:hypothetical protein
VINVDKCVVFSQLNVKLEAEINHCAAKLSTPKACAA